METEEPIELLALSRIKHKKWNKGGKADVVVCGKTNYGWSNEVKCEECGRVCYCTKDENLDLKKKNIKKVCLNCALTNYKEHLNEEQIKILKIALVDNEIE